jgi:hypothetical protein
MLWLTLWDLKIPCCLTLLINSAGTLNCPSIIRPDDENFLSKPSSVSKTFELFRLAFVRTSQQHGRTPLSVRQEKDFVPKHRYGKTAATVQTMCVPIRTLSFIRQVGHTKFNRPDVSLHGPDTQASYMEIACISSTVRTSAFMVQTLKALIWKLRAAKVQSSEH